MIVKWPIPQDAATYTIWLKDFTDVCADGLGHPIGQVAVNGIDVPLPNTGKCFKLSVQAFDENNSPVYFEPQYDQNLPDYHQGQWVTVFMPVNFGGEIYYYKAIPFDPGVVSDFEKSPNPFVDFYTWWATYPVGVAYKLDWCSGQLWKMLHTEAIYSTGGVSYPFGLYTPIWKVYKLHPNIADTWNTIYGAEWFRPIGE